MEEGGCCARVRCASVCAKRKHELVVSNNIVHADHHGAVMIPDEAVKKIPDVVAHIQRREGVILAAAKAPGFDIEKLKAAMKGAREIH